MAIRVLKEEEYHTWNKMLDESCSGSAFHYTDFLKSLNTAFQIIISYENERLLGGFVCILNQNSNREMFKNHYPFIPYQGFVFFPDKGLKLSKIISYNFKVTEEIIKYIVENFDVIRFANTIEFKDLRPITWETYFEDDPEKKFKIEVEYTTIVNIEQKEEFLQSMRKDFRQNLKKAEKNNFKTVEQIDFNIFKDLYIKTFAKRNIKISERDLAIIENIFTNMAARNMSRSFITYKEERPINYSFFLIKGEYAYHLWGANDVEYLSKGSSVKNLVDSFFFLQESGIKKIDMVGVNSPQRGNFKLGLGGQLESYYIVSKDLY